MGELKDLVMNRMKRAENDFEDSGRGKIG